MNIMPRHGRQRAPTGTISAAALVASGWEPRLLAAASTTALLAWAMRRGRGAAAGARAFPPLGEAVWICGFVTTGALRTRHFGRLGSRQVERRCDDPRERLAFGALLATTGLAPLLWLATGRPAALDHPPPRPLCLAAGTTLTAAGTLLLWRAHRDLGPNYSPVVELHAAQALATEGAYRYLRHPIYAGIGLMAQALLLPNWLAGGAAPLAWGVLCALRLPREERLLAGRFGPAWHAYAARTGALLPRFSL